MGAKELFCVTGCGRSGTGYTAKLLSRMGILTGHEDVFAPDGKRPWRDLDGDVSCFALSYLPKHGVKVVHLVRHPVLVCRSYATRTQIFGEDPPRDYYGRCFFNYDCTPWTWDNLYDRVAAFWIRWNRSVEQHAVARFRIEDLRDTSTISKFLDVIGHPRTVLQIEETTASLDPKMNTKPYDPEFSVNKLCDPLAHTLGKVAKQYGYDLTEIVS